VHEVEGGTEDSGSDDHSHGPPPSPALSEIGLDHGSTEAHTPQPNPSPNPRPSTDPDPEFDWNYWQTLEDTSPPRPASSKLPNSKPSTKSGVNWKYWLNPLNLMNPLVPGATRPASSKLSNPKPPPTKSGVSWKYWLNPLNVMDPLVPGATRPVSSKSLNPKPSDPEPSNPGLWAPRLTTKLDWHPNLMAAHLPPPLLKPGTLKIRPPKIVPPEEPEYEVVRGPSPSPELAPSSPNLGSPKAEYEVVPGPSPSPELAPSSPHLGSPKEPFEDGVVPGSSPSPDRDSELHSDHLSSSASSQPDLPAAVYAAKGKAKESPRVSSGTTRDVGHAAQRELQPGEGSLDAGE
jgi:hypothetical protein